MRKRRLAFVTAVGAAVLVAATGAAASAAPAASTADTGLGALPISAPHFPGLINTHRTASTDCLLPAETLGVQGFPNLFKAISGEIAATPPGTVFSLSLAATEQDFGGAAAVQTARFDQVFQAGLAKHDNFFAASGDFGSLGISKQHKETGTFPGPTAWWPASSPFVVAVGGTQLQDGWTWNPSSNRPFPSTGDFNPPYPPFTNTVHRPPAL